MLGDKYKITIEHNKEEYDLIFTYRTIKNIWDMEHINPLTYISDFIKVEDNNKKDMYLGKLIFAMSNAKLGLKDIHLEILTSDEIKLQLTFNLIALITTELSNEYDLETQEDIREESSKEKQEEQKQLSIEEENNNFIKWFNNAYSIANTVLNKTEDEFLDMTPRELKTLEDYKFNYDKNVLIGAYIDVMKANSKAQVEAEEKQENEDVYGGRASNLFGSITL